MSINLKKNKIDLKNKWEEFMKTKEDNSWILFGFKEDNLSLSYHESGDNGIQQLVERLRDDQIMYGAIFVKDQTMSLPKMIFIFWQGEAVPFHFKGKIATYNTEIKKIFAGNSIDIIASSKEDLSIDAIKDKMRATFGSNYSINEDKGNFQAKTHNVYWLKKIDTRVQNMTERDRKLQFQSQLLKLEESHQLEANQNLPDKNIEPEKEETLEMYKDSNTKYSEKWYEENPNMFTAKRKGFNSKKNAEINDSPAAKLKNSLFETKILLPRVPALSLLTQSDENKKYIDHKDGLSVSLNRKIEENVRKPIEKFQVKINKKIGSSKFPRNSGQCSPELKNSREKSVEK
uniref:Drebrin-like protein A (Trinotate prediction) n=1 Tax=Myxobolus squamalis TaxID=59785 RepID=A0A6B2FXI5_MYXSQ